MQVKLKNKDRVSMIMIGNYIFTYDEPEHEIHLDELGHRELSQLLYNCQRGVFQVEDPKALQEALTRPTALPKMPTTPKQQGKTIAEYTEEEIQELKSLLNKRVSSIKKEAKGLSPSKLRKLLQLESNGKSRKTLILFLDELVALHKQYVADKVGTEDLQINSMNTLNILKQGMDNRLDLDNISDIVESDVEQVVLNPLADEDS